MCVFFFLHLSLSLRLTVFVCASFFAFNFLFFVGFRGKIFTSTSSSLSSSSASSSSREGGSLCSGTNTRTCTHTDEKRRCLVSENYSTFYYLLWILVIAASIINIHSYKELYTINFRDALLDFLLPVFFSLRFDLSLCLFRGGQFIFPFFLFHFLSLHS